MTTLLFVHGTGVRAEGFKATTRILRREMGGRPLAFSGYELGECYWGDDCGVKLPPDPKSVPDYKAGPQPTAEEQELAKWLTLSCDPFFELREAIRQEGEYEPDGPVSRPPCAGVPARIGAISPEGELLNLLNDYDLKPAFDATVRELASSGSFRSLCDRLAPQPGVIVSTFARMIAAMVLAKAENDSLIQVDGAVRDRLVLLLIAPLGGRKGAVMNIFGAAMGTMWSLLGPGIRWATTAKRSDLTNGASPVAGDIVAYQGPRGEKMRDRIASDIAVAAEETDAVVLLAHSLGGIACVDLLIERKLPKVTHLVTVGSQAPFLYEMGALCKLPYGNPLPEHFPKNWLNVYDRHDILGYRASGVFPNSDHIFVEDLEVDSGQPFPQAHGAYWSHREFWDKLPAFLKRPAAGSTK